MSINKIRKSLYTAQKILGDVNSLQTPEKAVKRVIRKKVETKKQTFLNSIFKYK